MGLRRWVGFAVVTAALAMIGASPATSRVSLKAAAGNQFLVGVAIRSNQLDDPAKVSLILDQFDCLTAEYEFFPQMLHPAKGVYVFAGADRIVDFAAAHRMPLTGHMLCWNQFTPQWMFQDERGNPLPRAAALANLKAHIDAVVAHFKGKLSSWDVVNEAVSDEREQYLRDTPALRAIGEDYVAKAFEFAHAADPNVSLYYNDFNVENPVKLPKVIRLVRSLKAAGVRLDAVGIQGHWRVDYPPAAGIEKCIVALGNEGVKVIITELDVDVLPYDAEDPYRGGVPVEMLRRQAARYAELFRIFKKHRDVIGRVTFWGLEDGQSWLNDHPTKGRTNYPLLFDRQLRAKPAYDAVVGELMSN